MSADDVLRCSVPAVAAPNAGLTSTPCVANCPLTRSIQGHPTTEVSRKAKALVFGFQAMSFLKTENISYAVKKDEYLKYFR
jgi:hypothetical protein